MHLLNICFAKPFDYDELQETRNRVNLDPPYVRCYRLTTSVSLIGSWRHNNRFPQPRQNRGILSSILQTL